MKNIIKRVIVGVLVGVTLMFIKSCDVHAQQLVLQPDNMNVYYLTKTGYPNINSTKFTQRINGLNFITWSQTTCNTNSSGTCNFYGFKTYLYQNNIPTGYFDLSFQIAIYATYNGSQVANGFQSPTVTLQGFSCFTNQDVMGSFPHISVYNVYCPNVDLPGYANISFFMGELYQGYINETIYFSISDLFSYSASTGELVNVIRSDSEVINSIESSMNENNRLQQEQNDFLKDTSTPDSSEYDFSSNNANNGVINQLVTMPITLTQAFLNGFSGGCSSFSLGNLLGTELSLPCLNPGQYLGSVWNIIDVIISGLFIYAFGKRLVKIFNDVTNLKENQIDEVFD